MCPSAAFPPSGQSSSILIGVLFHEHETTGVPPMRPLWMEYPEDQDTFAIENEHFLGKSI